VHLRCHRRALLAVTGWLLAGALSCGPASSSPNTFVPLQRDFAGYTSWTRVDLGDAPLAGHPAGPRAAYVNHPLPPGAREYPVGTIIVKEIHTTDWPYTLDLFAMAKRGGDYDPNGAVGWEFFKLLVDSSGTPVIQARGINPSGNDPYTVSGTGGCNGCHAAPGTDETDHILSPMLQPGTN
jgi:hypothetical protein